MRWLIRGIGLACLALVLGGCGGEASSGADAEASEEAIIQKTLPEQAEIKVVLLDATFDPSSLGASTSHREIRFYDTASLDWYARGILLRTRRVPGKGDDATVKLRPMTPSEVDRSFEDEGGFKCELDAAVGAGGTSSCSLTEGADGSDIADASSSKDIRNLWSKQALRFARQIEPDFDAEGLRVYGPIDSTVWKLEPDDLDEEITFERWVVPGGDTTLEASIKIKTKTRATKEAAFVAWLNAHQLAKATVQKTKTSAALEALSKAPSGP